MQTNEPWFHNKWRPSMAWSYLIICLFDFIGGPMMYAAYYETLDKFIQWQPLTLRGGGIYHAAMLAILGVTAWGRTQEKLKMKMDDITGEMEVHRETDTFETIPQPPMPQKTIRRRKQ